MRNVSCTSTHRQDAGRCRRRRRCCRGLNPAAGPASCPCQRQRHHIGRLAAAASPGGVEFGRFSAGCGLRLNPAWPLPGSLCACCRQLARLQPGQCSSGQRPRSQGHAGKRLTAPVNSVAQRCNRQAQIAQQTCPRGRHFFMQVWPPQVFSPHPLLQNLSIIPHAMEHAEQRAAGGDSPEQAWLPGELFLQRLGSPHKSPLKPTNRGTPGSSLQNSPLKSPPGHRRLSTASGRRLSTVSARALPESHPVSPCSERGDASSDGADASSSPRPPLFRRRSSGGIPAYRNAAAASPPAHTCPAVEERVTLNLFVQEADTAAGSEVEQLQTELTALQEHVQLLEAAAAAAEQAAAAAAAECKQQQSDVGLLLLNVVEQPQTTAAVAPQQHAHPPVEPVQLVLHIVEPVAPPAAGDAAAAATLAAQLQRAEACREELARQTGQLKGRIAKVCL